jgi:hypothetical protein
LESAWRAKALIFVTFHCHGGKDAVIDAAASANPNTIVVLETGNIRIKMANTAAW